MSERVSVAEALEEFAMIDEAEGGNPLVIATERRAAELLRDDDQSLRSPREAERVKAVTLAECPIGLFRDARTGTLALKTEYGSNEGRIDAYIADSGEFYWGAPPQTIASQRAQLVFPVASDHLHPSPSTEGLGVMEVDPDSLRILKQFADQYRSGAQGRMMEYEAAQALALSIDDALSALEPVEAEADYWGVWSSTGMHIGTWPDEDDARSALAQYESLDPPMDGVIRPLYASPAPVTVDDAMVERYDLEWDAAPRLPVHLEPMRGKRSFPSLEKAVAFMSRQANDAKPVSLVLVRSSISDETPALAAALSKGGK